MKKMILVITAILFSFVSFSQTKSTNSKMNNNKMSNDMNHQAMNKSHGDGVMMMKEGQHMDMSGKMMPMKDSTMKK